MLVRLTFLVITCFWALSTWAGEGGKAPSTLQAALKEAYSSNPELAAAEARVDAEQSAVRSQSSLDDPKVGFSRESNMNFMELQQGPMDLISISQEIKFPAKY